MPPVVRKLSLLFPGSTKDFAGSKAAAMPDRDFMALVVLSVIGLALGLTFAFLVPLPEGLAALL
jgi:hypothetical protein